MHFTKMTGLGNDYLYIYGQVPSNVEDLCKKYSDRHFGVGSDGLIFISPSKIADFSMRIFNADGSEANMCGNGIRCVGKYVFEKGYTNKTKLNIETRSGIKTLELVIDTGKVKSVTVNMGKTIILSEKNFFCDVNNYNITNVSVGNFHAVVFVDDIANIDILKLGSYIANKKDYPDGVNVEFLQLIDKNTLRMRVLERGSGITLACGTGACASVATAVKKGYFNKNEFINVILDGGTLKIKINNNDEAIMSGNAEFICEGEFIC